MKLFVLANNVWDSNDWLNDNNTDPKYTSLYLYATKEEAINKAKTLAVSDDIYNDGTIYTGELSEEEILDITKFDDMDEWKEALAEPYSEDLRKKNFGEFEKSDVARAIIDDATDEETIECANYDFDVSLEGSILVFWTWHQYVGYARTMKEIRYASEDDTEAILTKADSVTAIQCDVLMTADEVAGCNDIHEALMDKLSDPSWKWNNESFVKFLVNEFEQ